MDHPYDGKKYKLFTNRLTGPKRFQHYIVRVSDGRELTRYSATSICFSPPKYIIATVDHLNCFGEDNVHKIPPQETDKYLLTRRKHTFQLSNKRTVQSWLGRII